MDDPQESPVSDPAAGEGVVAHPTVRAVLSWEKKPTIKGEDKGNDPSDLTGAEL